MFIWRVAMSHCLRCEDANVSLLSWMQCGGLPCMRSEVSLSSLWFSVFSCGMTSKPFLWWALEPAGSSLPCVCLFLNKEGRIDAEQVVWRRFKWRPVISSNTCSGLRTSHWQATHNYSQEPEISPFPEGMPPSAFYDLLLSAKLPLYIWNCKNLKNR